MGLVMTSKATELPPAVFVVDDDASVREALDSLFRSIGLQAKTFGSAAEFLQNKLPDAPSCLVLDVRLPGLSGLDFQTELAAAGLHIPIIFMTGHGDIPMTVKAMKAGAVEFLTKPVPEEILLSAIDGAIARSRKTLEQESQIQALRVLYSKLTPRERDVMALLVRGLLNKQVGGKLGMAEITVKAHRGQVMRKMNAASFADLVTMAARLGFELPGSDRT